MTGSVFISYRREDTSGYARAINNELRDQLGAENIFMDVDAIEPGLDFIEVIENAVGRCDILLTLIGPLWLDAGEQESPRIQAENDYVRTEIATALARNIRVIPVLLGEAKMPAPDSLPKEIIPLTRRNSIEIRHTHFDADVASLIKLLVKLVNPKKESVPVTPPVDDFTDTTVDGESVTEEASQKHKWLTRIATIISFTILGFLLFLFIDDLRISSNTTVGDEVALLTASVTTVLALIITLFSVRLSSKRWWKGVALGLPAYGALGFGVMTWLTDGLGARSADEIAFSIWITGFLITTAIAIWQHLKMKKAKLKSN